MKTVLVVDDSKTMVMSLTGVLEKSGFAVETAGDGVEALEKLATSPALVITDLNMPRMDGITFIKEARKAPGMRFTPILMLTTESQQEKRAEAKAAGATGWLVKPVGSDDLLQVVKQVLPGA